VNVAGVQAAGGAAPPSAATMHKRAQALAGVAISGLIGLVCWSPETDLPGGLGWMALLPLVWMAMPDRRAMLGAVLAFYIAASPTSYLAMRDYFPQWPVMYAVGAQACFLALLCLPWLLLPTARDPRITLRLAGLLGALTVSLVPPLGVISAWHPLLSAGWVWPAGSWWALGLVVGCWAVMAWRPSTVMAIRMMGALMAVGVAANAAYRDPPPAPLLAVDLSLPRAETFESFGVKLETMNLHLRKARLGSTAATPVVLPENAFEEWNRGVATSVQVALRRRVSEGPILAGTTFKDDEGKWAGVVLLTDGQPPEFLRARQPLVLGMWRPWDIQDHYNAAWSAPGVMRLQGQLVAIRVCSEEFPLFWTMLDKARHDLTSIVVVGNHYWSTTVMHDVVQGRHGRAAARLFGLPIVRAINRAANHPAAPR